MSRRTVVPVAFAALALAAAGCGSSDEDAGGGGTADEYSRGGGTTTDDGGDGAAGETLNGRVGPGFDISLDGTDGLAAGEYTITVDDRSSAHNFHLSGPGGVDVSTSVGGEGEESFQVTLEPGEYTFVCDPHAGQMRGSFTVD